MNEVDWPKISQRILETNAEAIRRKSLTSSTSTDTPLAKPALRVNENRYANPHKDSLKTVFRDTFVNPFMKGVNRFLCKMQKLLIPDTDCSSIDETPYYFY